MRTPKKNTKNFQANSLEFLWGRFYFHIIKEIKQRADQPWIIRKQISKYPAWSVSGSAVCFFFSAVATKSHMTHHCPFTEEFVGQRDGLVDKPLATQTWELRLGTPSHPSPGQNQLNLKALGSAKDLTTLNKVKRGYSWNRGEMHWLHLLRGAQHL